MESSHTQPIADRRAHDRFVVEPMYSAVRITPRGRKSGEPLDGHIYEISLGGMRFELDEPLPRDSVVTAELTLPGCEVPIMVDGRDLAWEAGAQLIVAVGTHATMVEFLDKGRKGMASTFLTRLRLGPVLVDAKGVSRLYEGRVRRRDVVFLIAAALLVIAVVVVVARPIHTLFDALRVTVEDLWYSITH